MTTTLTPEDGRSLEARWITLELAEQAGLFRVTHPEGAQLFGRNGAGNYAGIAIPNILPGQARPREYALRLDHPDLERRSDGETRPKARYLNPPGRSNMAYFPPGTSPAWLSDTALPIAVVEGQLKALALFRLAYNDAVSPRWMTVAIAGCWNWRGVIEKTHDADGARCEVRGPIADLDRIAWSGRLVYVTPDTSVADNPHVRAAWRELGKELERRGARCATVQIPPEPGINGIDDFLARHGPESGLKLFDGAEPRDTARDFHLTDLGNAQRLIARHGKDLLFVPGWKSWCVWDGRRWKRDDVLEVQNRAKNTVQALYAEAARLQDKEERKRLAEFALRSESAQKIHAMLELARSEVAVRADEFDTDPDLLNFRNGTLHLPAGELKPHRREDRITKIVDYDYSAQAQCPVFLDFLNEIMGGKQDQRRADRLCDYLQRAIGYAATGRTREKTAFVCHGSGDNGKTTLLATMRELLKECSLVLQVDSLMERRFESSNAQADLADLQGVRFVMTSETDEGQRLSASRLKRITQGVGTIRAVRKYENPVSFPETHKLFLDCNHRPRVRDEGSAIWNRLHLVPFLVTIPKEQQDVDLHAKLLAEAVGILAWIVEGSRRWYAEGLQKPPEVEAATNEWRRESDVLEAFFSERCALEKKATVVKEELYQAYREWAEKSGERAESKRAFGKKLLERGFEESRDGKFRYWIGLALVPDTTDTTVSTFSREGAS